MSKITASAAGNGLPGIIEGVKRLRHLIHEMDGAPHSEVEALVFGAWDESTAVLRDLEVLNAVREAEIGRIASKGVEDLPEIVDRLTRVRDLVAAFGLAARANPPNEVSRALVELAATTEERLHEARIGLEVVFFRARRERVGEKHTEDA